MLEQSGIKGDVELEVSENQIIIRPVSNPRQGWEAAFGKMSEAGEDFLLDEMNTHIRTVIVTPLTTRGKEYPTRVSCTFRRKKGLVVLDQIRTIDKIRLVKKPGSIDSSTQLEVIRVLQ